MIKKSVRDKLYARLDKFNKVELSNLLQYLDRERNLLDSIFNLLQEAILLVDAKGRIEFFNKAASQLLNLPKDNAKQFILWHWVPSLKNFFDPTHGNLHPDVWAKETELIYPEKKQVRLHIQTFPEHTQEQRFIVLLQDITQEIQEKEEQLVQERFDSVVQLASEVAHELGNPLNSMAIHLQLIQRALSKVSISEKVRHSLKICQDEIARLDEIIRHFLKAAQPKELQLKKEPIQPVIESVLSVLRPQLENLNIAVDLNIPHQLSPVFIDKARLHQAIFNVLKNCIEAIGTKGWIRISCLQDDQYLILAFADSGDGITGEQAASMLSEKNHTSKPDGHGIGMLIVRRVMREHNGFVEIESKKNTGSIIYLKLPLLEQSLKRLKCTE
ncbi:MAG: sensor histidine kinase [Opitutales bacterium]